MLWAQGIKVIKQNACGEHGCDQVEGLTGVTGSAPGKGVGPDDRTGFGVEPSFVAGWHGQLQPFAAGARMPTRMCSPVLLTRMAVSYATWPRSALLSVSTARQVPLPAAATNRKPASISMIVCRTVPPPKWLPAPLARDWKPAARAARCSASSRLRDR